MNTISSVQEGQNALNEYTEWYRHYLEKKFHQISLENTDLSTVPAGGIVAQLCQLCTVAIRKLSQGRNLTFDDLVAQLKSESLLGTTNENQTCEDQINGAETNQAQPNHVQTNEAQFNAHQLAFIIVGLTTMLYEPVLKPQADRFEIIDHTGGHKLARNVTWSRHHLKRGETTEKPINVLLKYLSTIQGPLPTRCKAKATEDQDVLQASNLSYYTLTKMANIRIWWVENVCEHLEFDPRSSTLKLFCLPSFCAMVCLKNTNKTFLDR